MTPSPFDIAPRDLLPMLADDDAPIVLDLRIAADVADIPMTLPGALPVDHRDIDAQHAATRGRGAVLFCHAGLKITYGAAARLCQRGVPVWRLTGGLLAWRDAGLPLFPRDGAVDRIAIPEQTAPEDAAVIWANARFVHPLAERIAVPQPHVGGVAEKFDAHRPEPDPAETLPGWDRLLRLVEQEAFLTGFRGLGGRTLRAFPLFDALYRGVLSGPDTVIEASRDAERGLAYGGAEG